MAPSVLRRVLMLKWRTHMRHITYKEEAGDTWSLVLGLFITKVGHLSFYWKWQRLACCNSFRNSYIGWRWSFCFFYIFFFIKWNLSLISKTPSSLSLSSWREAAFNIIRRFHMVVGWCGEWWWWMSPERTTWAIITFLYIKLKKSGKVHLKIRSRVVLVHFHHLPLPLQDTMRLCCSLTPRAET